MPDGRKIVELGEEIQKLPGYDIYFHHIKGLELSRYIFDKNYQDLAAILNFVTVDPRGNELHRAENKDKLNAFGYEIVCKLHNYVAAVETLVSHSRAVHVRLCEKNHLFPDYDERVNADFNNDPLAGFMQELRNYFLHEQAPDISFNTRFDSQWQPMRRACIPLKHLHAKKDWKARSQIFLQNLTGDVDILELSTTFKLKVTTFQDWFRMRLFEVFKEDLALLDEKRAEMQRLYQET
jgi:hypothetical protein